MAQKVKNLPAMLETRVQSLGGADPPEKEMATLSITSSAVNLLKDKLQAIKARLALSDGSLLVGPTSSTLLLGHSFLPGDPPALPPHTLRSKAHCVEAQKVYFLFTNSRHLGLCNSELMSQGMQRRDAQDHGLWMRSPGSVTKEAPSPEMLGVT